jgi:poly-beta-1,6-N-acetyl-D-glucosamine synthase
MGTVGDSIEVARGTEKPGSIYSYVLITPARNEAQFLRGAIESVARQTHLPAKWVIVSDGSTDGTDELVESYAAQYSWIELVRAPKRTERHFAGKVHAFNAGYARLKDLEYEVIGNLDADITFDDPGYFEFLMSEFAQNPRLGCGGTAYKEGNEIFPSRFTSLEDVFGACQMFRKECFEAIGGYLPLKSGGIDLIAFLSARSKGWQTQTFLEKICNHHRQVGSGHETDYRKRMLKTGEKEYLLGSHPVWQLFRCVLMMKNRPYVVGGVLLLTGYFWSYVQGVEKYIPDDLCKLRRKDQMKRLTGIVLHMRGYGR